MIQTDRNDGACFAPKRYGYGAGMPVRWQGWAVLGIYGLVLCAAFFALDPPFHVAIVLIATAILILVCAMKTRGGWRWRWGERD